MNIIHAQLGQQAVLCNVA